MIETDRKYEISKVLNRIFNKFIEQNISNTNFIFNKRCRILNKKNAKNISMNYKEILCIIATEKVSPNNIIYFNNAEKG
jgi:hypothetical protein